MNRRLAVVLAVILGAIAFLAVNLSQASAFYRNADEAVAKRASLGTHRFRLQGVVVPGSIHDAGSGLDFTVEFKCASVPVHHEGTQPALLKDGIPVVLEGAFVAGTAKTFDSDRIIIRHTEQYRSKASETAEATDKERCAGS